MRVLFATAEFSPLVSVGGLAEASAGLVHALRDAGLDVEVALPDYRGWELVDETVHALDVPGWASPGVARSGFFEGVGRVTLINVPGIERLNPYVDESGIGWPDNPDRFFAFSAAVAALATLRSPDLVHCNDWHTAAVPGFLDEPVPIVLTIHTLGYQGWTSGGWLNRIPHRPDLFGWHGGSNPLAGGIQLADAVVAVSPTYAREILRPDTGSGLDGVLRNLGDRLVGIRNGIDTSIWNPAEDSLIPQTYTVDRIEDKDVCRIELIESVGWSDADVPTVGIVSRLVEQKGIDIALDTITYAEHIPFRMVLVGSGEQW
ncbi:MAG: glycogen/starch synthase, partial [Actinomycetia bacterium]|nr:glycogen/starch synthase [Actinomycetes bacterium]